MYLPILIVVVVVALASRLTNLHINTRTPEALDLSNTSHTAAPIQSRAQEGFQP